MKKWRFIFPLVLTSAVALSPAAFANHTDDEGADRRTSSDLFRGFSEEQRREIRQYYRDSAAEQDDDERGEREGGSEANGKGKKNKHKAEKHKQKALPKGLQKKLARGGSLPPGWERKLKKGEPLSPEMRANSERLPEDLARVLDPSGDVAEIIRIQDKVVRVSRGEGTIIDVIDLMDVLQGAGVLGTSN